MRRRKIIWYKIYIAIGRQCKLKEMTMEEMNVALGVVNAQTGVLQHA
jgi:hypothetical protein